MVVLLCARAVWSLMQHTSQRFLFRDSVSLLFAAVCIYVAIYLCRDSISPLFTVVRVSIAVYLYRATVSSRFSAGVHFPVSVLFLFSLTHRVHIAYLMHIFGSHSYSLSTVLCGRLAYFFP
jgi:hypothetical protein